MVNRKVIALVSVALGFAVIGCEEKPAPAPAKPAAPKVTAPATPPATPPATAPATPPATAPATPEKPAAPK